MISAPRITLRSRTVEVTISNTYRISEFAARTGLTPRALRFYESKGLLVAHRSSSNDYRFYTDAHLEPAIRIRFLKGLGFSLDEIRDLLRFVGRTGERQRLRTSFEAQLERCRAETAAVENRITMLERVLDLLSRLETISFDAIHETSLDKRERHEMLQALQIEHASSSTIGKRDRNEDYTLVSESKAGGFYAIADGMAGRADLSHASELACSLVAAQLDYQLVDETGYQAHFAGLLDAANTALVQRRDGDDRPTDGTTLSFLVLRQGRAYIGHVGDTRIYRFAEGRLSQLTPDHTVIAQLLESGEILEKDVASHPMRSILNACVGVGERVANAFFYDEAIPNDACYLLVTDGITNVLSDAEITRVLESSADVDRAVQRLIALAAEHGEDNASAVGVVGRTRSETS